MGDYYLYCVLVRDTIDFKEAKKWSQYYIRNCKRKYMFKKDGWYRFRNIFKNRFSSLQMKTITSNVVIVYGTLKDDGMSNVRAEKGIEILSVTEGDGGTTREEVSVQTMPEELHETTAIPTPDGVCCVSTIKSIE